MLFTLHLKLKLTANALLIILAIGNTRINEQSCS